MSWKTVEELYAVGTLASMEEAVVLARTLFKTPELRKDGIHALARLQAYISVTRGIALKHQSTDGQVLVSTRDYRVHTAKFAWKWNDEGWRTEYGDVPHDLAAVMDLLPTVQDGDYEAKVEKSKQEFDKWDERTRREIAEARLHRAFLEWLRGRYNLTLPAETHDIVDDYQGKRRIVFTPAEEKAREADVAARHEAEEAPRRQQVETIIQTLRSQGVVR